MEREFNLIIKKVKELKIQLDDIDKNSEIDEVIGLIWETEDIVQDLDDEDYEEIIDELNKYIYEHDNESRQSLQNYCNNVYIELDDLVVWFVHSHILKL